MIKNEKLELAQKYLTEMLKDFVEFCDVNKIPYYIFAGTLLGAVRHKGFVPWDVDIDIILYRNDYERLLRLLKEKDNNFILSVPGDKKHYSPHALLYSKTIEITTRDKKNGKNIKTPLYIDLFPLDYTSSDINKQIRQAKEQKRIKDLLYLKRGVTERTSTFARIYVYLRTLLLTILPLKALSLALQKNMQKYSNEKDSHVVVNMASHYDYFRVMETDDIYGKPTKIKFNGLDVTGPEKAEKHLEKYYRNYKILPSEGAQNNSAQFIINCEKIK